MSLLILVEEEQLLKSIEAYISKLEIFKQIHVARTIESALKLSKTHVIKMFITDISISDGRCRAYIDELRNNNLYKLTWILILGEDKEVCTELFYSYDANLSNIFMLKPIDMKKLGKVAEEVVRKKMVDAAEENRLRIKRKSMDYFFDYDDIVFIETVEKMAYIHTTDEKNKVGRITLTELEGRLGHSKFIRVHRSYIINIDCIDQIKKQNNQNQIKVKYYNHMIPVGRTYKNVLGLVQ